MDWSPQWHTDTVEAQGGAYLECVDGSTDVTRLEVTSDAYNIYVVLDVKDVQASLECRNGLKPEARVLWWSASFSDEDHSSTVFVSDRWMQGSLQRCVSVRENFGDSSTCETLDTFPVRHEWIVPLKGTVYDWVVPLPYDLTGKQFGIEWSAASQITYTVLLTDRGAPLSFAT